MQIKIRDACQMMKLINEGMDCESYFEGVGNGEVKFIIEEKLIRINDKEVKHGI